MACPSRGSIRRVRKDRLSGAPEGRASGWGGCREDLPMVVDENTGLTPEMGVTEEMMACPLPRVPFIAPDRVPENLREELDPLYEKSVRMWGTVPRYLQMLAHAPAAVEAWILLDQRLRIDRLKNDPEYVRLMELVIVKTALLTQCNN